jgi:hypothetical protein
MGRDVRAVQFTKKNLTNNVNKVSNKTSLSTQKNILGL